jgi:hypothetical protein
MHRMVKASSAVGGAFLLLSSMFVQPARAQSAPTVEGGLAVVNAVLRFRLYWLEDRTQFDACSLYAQSGRPATFLEGIPSDLRDLVGPVAGEGDPCAQTSAGVDPPSRIVQVHSLTQQDTLAQVRLLVRKGDHSHIEDYTLRRTFTAQWDVADLRLWGRLYVAPPRQRG